MEQAVWEGMAVVEGLERVVTTVKGQTNGIEQAMHEKVGTTQIEDSQLLSCCR